MVGRPQESSRSGPTYQLAQFINQNWDTMVRRTNEDVAQELGYRSANMISMWRTGRTRISLDRLPDIARLMHLDISVLLPLWFEQYWGERDDAKVLEKLISDRIVSIRESEIVGLLRKVMPADALFTADIQDAIAAVVSDTDLRADVIAKVKAKV